MTDPDLTRPGFNEQIGFVIEHCDGDRALARLDVDQRHLQPFGLVHGGVYASIAEALASYGTAVGAGGDKFVAGASNLTHFLRPAFEGDALEIAGEPLHRGRTQWIWDIAVRKADDKLVAQTRVTIAVRDKPA